MTLKERGEKFYGRAWMEERKCKVLKLYYNFKNSNKQNIYFWPTVWKVSVHYHLALLLWFCGKAEYDCRKYITE